MTSEWRVSGNPRGCVLRVKELAVLVASLMVVACDEMATDPGGAARNAAIGYLEQQSGGGFDQGFSRALAFESEDATAPTNQVVVLASLALREGVSDLGYAVVFLVRKGRQLWQTYDAQAFRPLTVGSTWRSQQRVVKGLSCEGNGLIDATFRPNDWVSLCIDSELVERAPGRDIAYSELRPAEGGGPSRQQALLLREEQSSASLRFSYKLTDAGRYLLHGRVSGPLGGHAEEPFALTVQ